MALTQVHSIIGQQILAFGILRFILWKERAFAKVKRNLSSRTQRKMQAYSR
jgi:hypothetical protein